MKTKQICLLALRCKFLHLPERQLIPQLMIRKVSTFLGHCPSFFQREERAVGEAEDIKQRHLHKARAEVSISSADLENSLLSPTAQKTCQTMCKTAHVKSHHVRRSLGKTRPCDLSWYLIS